MSAPGWPAMAGTIVVARFNWPKFVGVGVLVVLAGIALRTGWPPMITGALALAASGGVVWSTTSLVSTWWSYDHRRVYDHVGDGLGDAGAWATVHAGFDEATASLTTTLGPPAAEPVGLTVAARPSLQRARRAAAAVAVGDPRGATSGRLPFASGSLDTVLLTFAIHEVRDPSEQRALFAELHRALAPGGRLVVTEHLRGVVNAAVLGPAVLHFQSRSTWVRCAAGAGFAAVEERALTPFVHRLVWARDPDREPVAAMATARVRRTA